MSTYLTGMILGGTIIGILGSVGEYMRENAWPKPKSVARDFIIGAILVIFLMQILPESMSNLLSFVPSLGGLRDKLPALGSLTGGALGADGPDLQIGPVRF